MTSELDPAARRVRGRVAVISALVLALAIPIGVYVVRNGDGDIVAAPKRMAESELAERDALAVGTAEQVRDLAERLDQSSEVVAYSRLEPGLTTLSLVIEGVLGDCDNPFDGLIIDLAEGADPQALAGDGITFHAWDKLPLPPGAKLWYDVEIFMNVDASTQQVDAVAAALANDDRITRVQHLTKDDALAEFRETFADEPALLETTTADDLPESFRLSLEDPDDAGDVDLTYQSVPGVDKTVRPGSDGIPDLDEVERVTSRFLGRGDGWSDLEVEVFMNVDADSGQIAAVMDAVEADSDVASYEFLTKEEALAEFRLLFADEPALVESTTAEVLPSSFRLVPAPDVDVDRLAARYDGLPGVDKVLTPSVSLCG